MLAREGGSRRSGRGSRAVPGRLEGGDRGALGGGSGRTWGGAAGVRSRPTTSVHPADKLSVDLEVGL
jgi:hypothetical protein